MRHIGTVASRELRSLFVSPVAYAVLTLFAVLAGAFFLTSLLGFNEILVNIQQLQRFDQLQQLNLNDHLISGFIQVMAVVLLFVVPGVTMGLFANEKANGTEELLHTSPLTIWDMVLGKYLGAGLFVGLMVLLVALFPGLLFMYGDPEVGKTVTGLLGLLLLGLTYAAIGTFASSLTRNQLIAFLLTWVILIILSILPFLAELGLSGGSAAAVLKYLSTAEHFDDMLGGLIDTRDLVYFLVMTTGFLVLTKTAVESVRWR